MKRRSYKELVSLFDGLNTWQSYNIACENDRIYYHLVVLKTAAFLSHKLYGEKCPCPSFVRSEDGVFYYHGESADNCKEYLDEGSLCMGNLTTYALSYYYNSPHWEVFVRDTYADEDDFYYDEQLYGYRYDTESLHLWYRGCLDDDVLADPLNGSELFSLINTDGDYMEGMCIIKSSLFPYLEEFKKAAGVLHPVKIKYLENAFKVIRSWAYYGRNYSLLSAKNGYFISLDDGGSYVGNGEIGCLDFKKAVLVAGELIEEIMFSLDKKYHILPEEIVKKEEGRWKEGLTVS